MTSSVVTRLHLILRGKLNGRANRGEHALVIGDVLPCNIEGGAMVDRGSDDAALQSDRNVHALFDAHDLDRRMSLVMVAGHDDIEIASAGSEEQRIRREGADYINAFLLSALDAREQLFFFFAVTEQSVLARMRVDSADRDSGIVETGLFKVSWASLTTVYVLSGLML